MKVSRNKRPKKEDVLNAKIGRTYVTPMNKEYTFVEWYKMGRIYHLIFTYNGKRVNFKESDYNNFDLDQCLGQITV